MRIASRRPGRHRGEERVVILDERGTRAAEGLVFWGRPGSGLRPYADLVVHEDSVLDDVVEALGPGASVMVAYGGDETERELRRKTPPQVTPLGLALLRAGCRWFKDWYFPEGGMEGGTKLQGTVPLDAEHRSRAARKLLDELEEWRSSSPARAEDLGEALRVAYGILAADLDDDQRSPSASDSTSRS